MKIIGIALCCILLNGCWFDKYIIKTPDAFPLDCDERCFQDCMADKSYPIDESPDSGIVAKKVERELRKECNEYRKACVKCLQRGKDHGVITW